MLQVTNSFRWSTCFSASWWNALNTESNCCPSFSTSVWQHHLLTNVTIPRICFCFCFFHFANGWKQKNTATTQQGRGSLKDLCSTEMLQQLDSTYCLFPSFTQLANTRGRESITASGYTTYEISQDREPLPWVSSGSLKFPLLGTKVYESSPGRTKII